MIDMLSNLTATVISSSISVLGLHFYFNAKKMFPDKLRVEHKNQILPYIYCLLYGISIFPLLLSPIFGPDIISVFGFKYQIDISILIWLILGVNIFFHGAYFLVWRPHRWTSIIFKGQLIAYNSSLNKQTVAPLRSDPNFAPVNLWVTEK